MNQLTFILYILISLIVIIYVGNQCHKNGRIYILRYFQESKNYGSTLNDLLRIAYYLLNIGLAIWNLQSLKNIENLKNMILEISNRLSFVLLILGVLHIFNIYSITLIHKHLNKQL
jgi:hypothetical protein